MGVLVEVHSVIIRRESILKKYPGGWWQFQLDVPNLETFCFDNHLACISFMDDNDSERYIRQLQLQGLIYLESDKAVDIVMACQQGSFSNDCNWAEIWTGYIDPEGTQKVTVCEIPTSECQSLHTPDNWEYEKSLTKNCHFLPRDKRPKTIIYLGNNNGIDMYFDIENGKKLYVGRA